MPNACISTYQAIRFKITWLKLCIFLPIILSSLHSQNLVYSNPYNFTTIAGQILNGNGYLDGTGQNAVFNQPTGIALDKAGNMYIADTFNNVIRLINASGVVTTIAGQVGISGSKDGIGLNAQFGQIYGIAIDNSNNLYTTDFTNNSVRKLVNTGGTWTVSTLIQSSSGLNGPTGIAVDSNYNIYIADSGNGVIRKLNSNGSLSIFAGSIGSVGANNGPGANATFAYPVGLAIDASSNIYVTDSSANMIRKITPNAVVSTVAGSYGAPGLVDGLIASGNVAFSHPGAITCDSLGNIYISDSNSGSIIRIISNQGIVSTIGGSISTGGSDGSGSNASFSSIKGIAVDQTGVIYLTNQGTATIRKGTPPLLNTPPTFTSINANILVTLGNTYSLAVTTTGSSPITYNWFLNNSIINTQSISYNSFTSTLTLPNISSSQLGQYYVVASNIYGTAKSPLIDVALPIQIITQPQSITTYSGKSVSFSVTASGTALNYQWYFNGTPITGATQPTFTITTTNVDNLGTYNVQISNGTSSQMSQSVVLGFLDPAIINQPKSISSIIGKDVTFMISASGLSNNYQWYFNGKAIAGETGSILVLKNVSLSSSGNYSVSVINNYGNTTSVNASLTLINNPGRLINLSVLTLNTPINPLTLGFVIGGTGTTGSERLLIRADGPSLIPFGVSNTLADPTLTLQQGSAIISMNDNWGSNLENITIINAAEVSTGAYIYNNTFSLDAAIVQTLQSVSGGYTVTVGGNGTGTGYALAEIFDDTPSYNINSTRLINLSCIQQIPINGMLTAGFVIGGSTPITVLIRASGPALNLFGLSGLIMPDPSLTLVATSQQTVLATNNGWSGIGTLANAAKSVGAFPYTSITSKDSAILMTLPPGSYSAQCTSTSGVGGKAMIEVYEVP